jgi:hypothetical protein
MCWDITRIVAVAQKALEQNRDSSLLSAKKAEERDISDVIVDREKLERLHLLPNERYELLMRHVEGDSVPQIAEERQLDRNIVQKELIATKRQAQKLLQSYESEVAGAEDSTVPVLLALNSLVTEKNGTIAAILLLMLMMLAGPGSGAMQPRPGRRPPQGPMDTLQNA